MAASNGPIPKAIARRRGDAGMTLVEILIVLVILGLAVTLGATGWRNWRLARRIDDAVERIALLVQQSRTEAARAGQPQRIEIDAAQGVLTATALGRRVVLPEGIRLQATVADLGGKPAILLLPDGSSTGADLVLSRPGADAIRLTVAWTGSEVRRAP